MRYDVTTDPAHPCFIHQRECGGWKMADISRSHDGGKDVPKTTTTRACDKAARIVWSVEKRGIECIANRG
ncbi:unnamed protein product [Lampetra fluviatilis]